MEKRMERSLIYNGTITAEQFLFYEIRIASKYYLDGTSVEGAIEEIKKIGTAAPRKKYPSLYTTFFGGL